MSAGPFLILHGLEGSGPEHWQSWLARRLADAGESVDYPGLPDPFTPSRGAWLAALDTAFQRLGTATGEATVLCHSLACTVWLHHAARGGGPPVKRVLLVAPPSLGAGLTELEPFFPVPIDPAAVARAAGETRLVCSDDDPYCPEGAATLYGEPLRIPTELLLGAGHVNTDTGYGPWPGLEAWCYGANQGVET
jgi:predicted alpha/beta hydrolase family esterase